MKTRSDSMIRLFAAATMVGAAALMLTPVSARTPVDNPMPRSLSASEGWQPDPEPEELTAAEAGIDPMVTGPVSDEFRALQARLGCLEAKWPNVPARCYPDAN